MKAKRLQLIWEQGISLSEAFSHFAGENAIPITDYSKGLDIKASDSKAESIKNTVKALDGLANTILDIASIKSKQRDWLFRELDQQRLMALGYKATSDNSIALSVVPDPLLQSQFIDWDHSSISGLGTLFIDIKINHYQKFNSAKEASNPIGRPTNRSQIWAIIDQIGLVDLQQGCDFIKTAIAKEIHKIGLQQFPNKFSDTKPDSQTIIRHYNSYLENNSN